MFLIISTRTNSTTEDKIVINEELLVSYIRAFHIFSFLGTICYRLEQLYFCDVHLSLVQ